MNYGLEQWTNLIQSEDFLRNQRYQTLRFAYNGEFEYPDSSADPRDAVTLNYVRPIVDISVQTLIGEGLKFTIFDENAQEAFESFAKKANLTAIWRDLARNGSIFGHTFAKIVPGRPFPRIIPLAPEYVHVITDPHDYREVLRYRIEYTAVDPESPEDKPTMLTIRQDITRQPSGMWKIDDMVAKGNDKFVRANEEYNGIWPYQWPPIFGCQNISFPNEYYGRSDIEDVVSLNNMLNQLSTYLNRMVRIYSYPIVWGKGFSPKALDEKSVTSGKLLVVPSASADIDAVDIGGDTNSMLSAIELVRGAIYDIAQTPRVSMGLMERTSVLSALSLQVLYGPLLYKIREKRTLYEAFFVDIIKGVLALMGFRDVDVEVEWPDILPTDITQEHNIAIMRKTIGGISQKTILEGIGLDSDTEFERLQREQEMMQALESMIVPESKKGGEQSAVQPETVE